MKQVGAFLLFTLIFCVHDSHGFEINFGASKQDIPEWIDNPKGDDTDFIYGIGEGETLAKAVQSALNSISGKLATVVSSNISSETTLNQGKASVYFNEQVKTKTFDTKLTNYEVVKSQFQDEHYYAMLKMSRNAFVNDTVARLKIIDDRINNQVAVASKISKLQHYLALNEAKAAIEEATSLVFLLQAASPDFNSVKYLTVYHQYGALMNELLFKLKFKVEADAQIIEVADIIIRVMGNEKLSASLSKNTRADASLIITGTAQNSTIFSEYATQLRIKIQVKDKSGRLINTEEYIVGGSSLTNYDASKITAINLLQNKLTNEGAYAILGLKKSKE